MHWFVYLIISTATPGDDPVVHRLPQSPSFQTEDECTDWLLGVLHDHRLEMDEGVLATCMSPPEPV
jgi:hypothetical protein